MEEQIAVRMLEPEADTETLAYAMELEAMLPEGDGPTVQELQADYLLEKMREEQAALRHLADFTERRVDMIRQHADIEGQKIQRRLDYLESKLRMCVPYDPDAFVSQYGKKSIKLPHGTIGYRSSKETVEIRDKDAALAFAKANGLDIKVTETVNKTPLLDYVKATGDVPDPDVCGFELVPGSDDFFVKAGA